MRVYCYTPFQLCRPNLLDLAQVRAWLQGEGAELVARPEQAEVIVVHTCAFDHDHEEQSLREVIELHRRHPQARIVVGGCLPEIAPEALGRVHDGPAFSPQSTRPLAEALGLSGGPDVDGDRGCGSLEIPRPAVFRWLARGWSVLDGLDRGLARVGWRSHGLNTLVGIGFHLSSRTLFVRATEGCLGHCTYCAIRKARGRLRSQPAGRILESVRQARDRGFRTVALVGDDLSVYGQDCECDLPELLEQIVSTWPGVALALDNVHPAGLVALQGRLDPVLNLGAVRYLEVPVQSGSDRVLAAMQRPYTAIEAGDAIRELKQRFPQTVVATHLMVGFPGEREEDFVQSLAWLRDTPVDHAVVLQYQERRGTPAVELPDPVPLAERRRRRHRTLLMARARLVHDLARRLPPARSLW